MENQTNPVALSALPGGMLDNLVKVVRANYTIVGVTFFLLWLGTQLLPSRNKLPIMNKKKWYEVSWQRTVKEFTTDTKGILQKALDESDNKPFQLYTNQGLMTVLPPRFINEIRNEPRLDSTRHFHRAFFGAFPGFEGINKNILWLLITLTNKYITTNLTRFTKPMSDECGQVLKEALTDAPDWHQVNPSTTVSQIVSRVATRGLLGKDFCEDPNWIKSLEQYATTFFFAAERFSVYHPYIRPIAHWFLPYCRKLRANSAQCSSIMQGVLKKRKEAQGTASTQNTIEWAQLAAKGKEYDPAQIQLSIGLGGIATTTNMLSWFLLCISKHPECLEPLRKEIISVLRDSEGGWKKTTIYNMKLLDSAMKESQRLKPLTLCTMRRLVLEDMTLSDGTFLPKGTMLVVSSSQLRDPQIYPNPDKFDIYRFYNMRQIAGNENAGQFVTTSQDYSAWGHGKHACPGRFLASNQIKIVLCHLLVKYDFRLAKGSPTDSMAFGFSIVTPPTARIEVRRRKEEIDLDSFTLGLEDI
ncbi:hypothetical protein PV08_04177 [Exophiala spinifera]|uniref:Cytochrome P450 n=1 Tax=Exophiala spinifera TaxID=91928 RepID=A0A0D1YPA1_9EURO|nr:uncharacterized protein PV08_04177 [Exophiala spinifera]KIW16986.1 hypothetical protein PV08_04177 [Exophiala spinifera]